MFELWIGKWRSQKREATPTANNWEKSPKWPTMSQLHRSPIRYLILIIPSLKMAVLRRKNHKVKWRASLKVQFKGSNFHPFSSCLKYKNHSLSIIRQMLQTLMIDSKLSTPGLILKNSLIYCNWTFLDLISTRMKLTIPNLKLSFDTVHNTTTRKKRKLMKNISKMPHQAQDTIVSMVQHFSPKNNNIIILAFY